MECHHPHHQHWHLHHVQQAVLSCLYKTLTQLAPGLFVSCCFVNWYHNGPEVTKKTVWEATYQPRKRSRVLLRLSGFPLSRNFTVRSHIKFTCVNEIEAMYERPGGSTLTYTRDLLYTLFILFTRTYGNPNLQGGFPLSRNFYVRA